jgi:antitoxin HicB
VTFPASRSHHLSNTREEALEMAADALVTAMDFYFERPSQKYRCRRPQARPGARGPAPSVAVKVLLLNELLDQGLRNAELARRMHT